MYNVHTLLQQGEIGKQSEMRELMIINVIFFLQVPVQFEEDKDMSHVKVDLSVYIFLCFTTLGKTSYKKFQKNREFS